MSKVIFDTNIYGLLLKEKNSAEIEKKIKEDKNFIVYSYQPIRQEIRAIPKVTKLSKKARILLLEMYDRITAGHFLENSIQINKLALKFYNSYRTFGGIRNWKETNIDVDFTIVACATLYKLDIVVSDDSKTMFSKPAVKAFKHVTMKEGLWNPNFWKYSDLKMKYDF